MTGGETVKMIGPDRYTLQFDSQKFSSKCSKGTNRFSGFSTKKVPKLYTFSAKGELIYVGTTIRSMRARLRDGWSASGETGYYGYRLRHELTEADLDVWLLDGAAKEDPAKAIETIEAEVVYLIRCGGQWPRFQTEIHFHCSDERHRSAAKFIYDHYKNQAI